MPDSPNLIDRQKNAVKNEQHSVKENIAEDQNYLIAEIPRKKIQAKKNADKLAVFFRSSGMLYGTYLPSEESKYKGIFMTEEGLFPATCGKDLMKFLKKRPKKKTIKRQHHFIGWILGTPDPPYYKFHLVSRTGKKNIHNIELFPQNNLFVAQGIVTDRSPERIMLRVQKNIRPHVTNDEIKNSVNYLEIRDCPGKVRNSQFWLLRTTLKDGFLHYQSGELLANAKEAKKFLKQQVVK